MLVDTITIRVTAGHGGKGAVSFNTQKMALGPTGAAGGNGGDVFLEAVADLGALRHFRTSKVFKAENGEDGRSKYRDGHAGTSLVLKIPRGTVVRSSRAREEHELTKIGERLLVAKSGRGGRGNFHFKSSTNTSPRESEPGFSGESVELALELKLIADIGLVGFPNVGKSSFLNAVTQAQSPVANYAFTTLEPHLGSYHGLILADLPGLMEGASSGKGLGIKFLRHVERTHILFHFVDAGSDNPLADYKTIRAELGAYNKILLRKSEYILISKSDSVDSERLAEIIKKLKETNREVLPISIYNDVQMDVVKNLLNGIKEGITVSPAKDAFYKV